MLNEYLHSQQHKRRRARHWDIRGAIGPLLCGLVLAYLMTAALVGMLAG
jgi:hypothetical protein